MGRTKGSVNKSKPEKETPWYAKKEKVKNPIKKKEEKPKEPVPTPPVQAPESTPEQLPNLLPIIEGSQALEIMAESNNATLYRLENGTTVWVPKS